LDLKGENQSRSILLPKLNQPKLFPLFLFGGGIKTTFLSWAGGRNKNDNTHTKYV
jgi:hypothetical protein